MKKQIVFNGVTLAEACEWCYASGKITLENQSQVTCGQCGGKGTVETEHGHALRMFIQTHLGVEATFKAK